MSMAESRITRLMRGQGLLHRAVRGSALTMFGFVSAQVIRLGSNLILTRLLFPEVFGIMALIMVVMQGLNNFSDVGIGPAILQSRRGDDRAFLNTAFTYQAIRGVGLWLGCCILAVPAARFYDAPELAWYLPVAGLTAILSGLLPTRVETANRHLQLARLTAMELVSSLVTVALTVALAAMLRSAWALVIALVLGSAIRVVIADRMLPGERNRFGIDPDSGRELRAFGKWIFPSTIVGFVIAQGDKMILGKYLTLGALGLYNIAFFLASVPLMLGMAVVGRILIPVYRDSPPSESRENFLRLRRFRTMMTGGFLVVLVMMALLGPALVGFLYDPRYAAAGPLVTLIACATIPQLIVLSYDQAALAAGDSRQFFVVTLIRAVLFIALFLPGVHFGGIAGGLLGQALAAILSYPAIVWLARRHGAWDPAHDAVFAGLGLAVAAALMIFLDPTDAITVA